jgi:hypothetical protein
MCNVDERLFERATRKYDESENDRKGTIPIGG